MTAVAIIGVHAILFSQDPAADRAFLEDALGLASVDAGEGWLVFALPPAELAAHPASADGGGYDLHLMCDDVEATVRELKAKGVEFSGDVTRQRWGLITAIELPGGGRLGLYEPLHASPLLPAR
jgi:catechol 2,3-dioxygenase-like lactoylglutathione lyase family enzyme